MALNGYEEWLKSLGVNTMTMLMNGERCGFIDKSTGDVTLKVGGVEYIMDDEKCPPQLVPLLLQIMEMESLIDNLSHDKSLVQLMKTPEQLEREKRKAQEGPIIIEFDKDWWLTHERPKKR